jgi:hypothetical protein
MYDNFGNAPTEQGGMGELIPDGTLAWAILKVRPFNLDQGMCLTPSKSTDGNAYLDIELTVIDGPYSRRKVWDRIMLEATGPKADGVKGRAMAAVRHILEVGREIDGFAATDPKYRLGQVSGAKGDMVLMELDELRCAVKVGVETAAQGSGYKDKNKVVAYLSPNPASDTHKAFMKLVAGETAPAVTAAAKPATPAAGPSWAQKPAGAPAAKAAPQAGRPSWAGAAPVGAKSDEIPY